ncbi:MAG: hypothetical protein IKU57_04280 [Oscillospiraceae bacterium]|nr:hypothetical protein [Oscillospiraceae bacterium]
MDEISAFFAANGISFATGALILLVSTLVIALLGRFIFGKQSALSYSVSSAIAIIFLYAVTVVLITFGANFSNWIAPLPFATFTKEKMQLFSFQGAHYAVVCSEILSMIILAFLVNIVDGWLSKAKNFFTWLFLRCATVVLAYLGHLLIVYLFNTFLPEGLVTYAPTVLLAILIMMLLTGSLKLIIGLIISTVNPIIGGLYTFFFATAIGKKLSRAVLTTGILAGIVWLLQYFGITSISIVAAALAAYIPFILILIALWYLVNRIL